MDDPSESDPDQTKDLAAQDLLLVQRMASGDRTALAWLVRRYQKQVWSVAFRCSRQRDDADDLTQEAFVRLWQFAPRFQPTGSVLSWLFRVVTNLCLDNQRKRRRVRPLEHAGTPEAESTEDPLARDERQVRIRAAVQELPERQRLALMLHRFEGQSYRQIAQTTGWSESAVESLVFRAYETLRRRLHDLERR